MAGSSEALLQSPTVSIFHFFQPPSPVVFLYVYGCHMCSGYLDYLSLGPSLCGILVLSNNAPICGWILYLYLDKCIFYYPYGLWDSCFCVQRKQLSNDLSAAPFLFMFSWWDLPWQATRSPTTFSGLCLHFTGNQYSDFLQLLLIFYLLEANACHSLQMFWNKDSNRYLYAIFIWMLLRMTNCNYG